MKHFRISGAGVANRILAAPPFPLVADPIGTVNVFASRIIVVPLLVLSAVFSMDTFSFERVTARSSVDKVATVISSVAGPGIGRL